MYKYKIKKNVEIKSKINTFIKKFEKISWKGLFNLVIIIVILFTVIKFFFFNSGNKKILEMISETFNETRNKQKEKIKKIEEDIKKINIEKKNIKSKIKNADDEELTKIIKELNL